MRGFGSALGLNLDECAESDGWLDTLLGALLPAVLSTVIGLGPIGDFLFGVAWDLLAGRSLHEALINGVMSSMIGMAIRWLGEATGLIPTHVDAPHYRGTINGQNTIPGSSVDVLTIRGTRGANTTQRPTGGQGPDLPGTQRGTYSGRDYDPSAAGGPVRELNYENVRITERGIDVVERHVSRFGPDDANAGMIDRLRRIRRGDLEATDWDKRYYTHELRESVRYRRLGWESDVPAESDAASTLWQNAHTATLEDYRLHELLSPGTGDRTRTLFHPDVWDGK